ncbi:putative protein kinase RLK-Pelle-L-LEC family [Rosa chinensis]|uniref:Protein kinase domain-containing protein n=1 Tax=Rosa chinensis TaxID=74649 RepID=A0A2P6RPM2_ROSCH|nr:putative protein kinase RLK-Pelle-L-LEC family [Rosa chinensis]
MVKSFKSSASLHVLFSLLFLPYASSIYFKLPRFEPNAGNILYQGDAAPSIGAIDLISTRAFVCRVGLATYAQRVPLWDSSTGKLTDFTTHFSFIINTDGYPTYGHGIAFFLAPVGFQLPPNSVGGFLGLFNTTTSDSSGNKIVLVEFDSFINPQWDPGYQHVGINNNSIASSVSTPWNASLHSGDTTDVWIVYNATTKNLSVHWSYQNTSTPKENTTSLHYQLDLKKILPEWITIGFSAATSQFGERNRVVSWEFSSTLDRKETTGKNSKKKKMKQKKRQTPETENLNSMNEDLERGAGPRRFSYTDLATATNNFSNQRKLGEGGFGAVYRGYLADLDTVVAVKKISSGSRQGRKEYRAEVKIISSLRHRNLVQLIGWCHDGGQFLLVYEFMPNGSLDAHLFGKSRSALSWAMRYKISLGLGSALLYLHEEWEQCVVHRDIKSSNIMLDSSFNVKLGDFGLARLVDHELGPQTTGVVGTLGYMAPEYFRTGRASKESDVYSFGVVILEIVTGKGSVDRMGEDSEMGLIEWVWDLYGKGNFLMAVDEKLHSDYNEKQAECMIVVGLWCVHPDKSLRPSIRQAVHVLNFEAALPNVPPNMPVPTYQVPTPSVSSGEPLITTSLEEGR